MLPILQENDVVYYQKFPFLWLKVNDLILFNKNKQLVCHRVIYKKGYTITKGDNNPKIDGKIKSSQIIGRITKIKRNGQTYRLNDLYLFQSTLYFQEIVKIKKRFEKKKINFVFLKGLPLHLYFEENHPRRLYADCDVLVDKKDFDKAKKILSLSDYKSNDARFSPAQKKLKNKGIESSFLKIINGVPVVFDIHLEPVFLMVQIDSLNPLYPQKLLDQLTDEFLKNKQQITINNQQFYILNTRYLILYLALHFFHHNFRGAFRLEFIDKVIRKSRLTDKKWGEIMIEIEKYRLKNFVFPVFLLLKKYYQTPIPNFINFKNFTNFKNSDIFNDETRLEAGINRFKNIFFLSPRPLIIKLGVFFNPAVIYLTFFSLKKRLFYFFSTHLKIH